MELLIVYRLALSAVTATFGTAFAKWFFTTKIGVWVQQKFEAFMNYLQKKYDLQTIGFYLINKFRDLQYIYHVPYRKQDLAKKMLTKQKFIADYNSAYDVYFYVKADTKVSNKTMDDSIKDSTNKRILKKAFMSGMKKRLTSRVLLTNFIKRIA